MQTEQTVVDSHNSVDERLQLSNHLESSYIDELLDDVRDGLSAANKFIPSKYFYDKRGSELFEQICELDEYYLTRTELSIIEKYSSCIMSELGSGDLVELGSGANLKIKQFLNSAPDNDLSRITYVPVDVSSSAVIAASRELLDLYEGLTVRGIIADFTGRMDTLLNGHDKLILFLGSTIGNLNNAECHDFLSGLRSAMRPSDRCLIGIDMYKDKEVIESAYNDQDGITASFNKNVLSVMNRELEADFNPDHFDHYAFFDSQKGWVEMHLRANKSTSAYISALDMNVKFSEGETIHTEISRKFRREEIIKLSTGAGLAVSNWYEDERGWFSLVEFKPAKRQA